MKRNVFLLSSLGLAVLAGGVFAFGYIETTKTVPVIVAKTPIPMNTNVTPDELTVEQVPTSFAKNIGAVQSDAQLGSHYLNVSVQPGEPITQSMVSTDADMQSMLTNYAQSKNSQGVMMQLPVADALEGLVQPGMDVGLVINPQNGGNVVTHPTVVGPIHVLSVLGASKAAAGAVGNGNAATMLLFIPNDVFNQIGGSIIANQVKVILFPTNGTLPQGSIAAATGSTNGQANGQANGKNSQVANSQGANSGQTAPAQGTQTTPNTSGGTSQQSAQQSTGKH